MMRFTQLNAMLANDFVERSGGSIGQSCFFLETETANFQTANSFLGHGIDQVIDRTVVATSVHSAAYITDFKLGHSNGSNESGPTRAFPLASFAIELLP